MMALHARDYILSLCLFSLIWANYECCNLTKMGQDFCQNAEWKSICPLAVALCTKDHGVTEITLGDDLHRLKEN